MSSGVIQANFSIANFFAKSLKVDCSAGNPPAHNASTTVAENSLVNSSSSYHSCQIKLGEAISRDADAIQKIGVELSKADEKAQKIISSL